MYCTKCGSELADGVKHCYVCGAAVRRLPPLYPGAAVRRLPPLYPGAAGQTGQPGRGTPAAGNSPLYEQAARPGPPQNAPAYQTPPASGPARQAPPASPAYHYPAYHHDPAAGTPDTVGVLDWLLSTLLVLLVPVVRFVMLCVWAFGAGAKPSKRSWARAMLILFVVFYVCFIALCVYYAAAGPGFPYS